MHLLTAADTDRRHPFRLSDLPYDDHWEGYVLGQDDVHRFLWIWQGFNIRVIAVPHGDTTGYDHAWCYPRDPAAVEAAIEQWDPDVEDEPLGWHKRATTEPRRAPHRDRDRAYNRPRCRHGDYIHGTCRTTNCPDAPGGRR
ncbi:hypothetical protein [Streptomyces sp. 2P-4]|uniref:hypothetical protein n=1 Tax=Streptomyces sp. 2P-4 TaxID=2931974 RepID=UPI0025404755|nr:hypothetical protein [Streptomyces sp. 2P-4]